PHADASRGELSGETAGTAAARGGCAAAPRRRGKIWARGRPCPAGRPWNIHPTLRGVTMMPRYTHLLSALLGLAVMLGTVGCASVEKRIAVNREYFESRPEAIRQQIREGKVDIGFTQKDVYLALGPPDARYSRRTTSGQSAVWAYW